jgi:hypothetical protein
LLPLKRSISQEPVLNLPDFCPAIAITKAELFFLLFVSFRFSLSQDSPQLGHLGWSLEIPQPADAVF